MVGTYKKEIVIFWLCSQVLKDRLLPVPFHVIPILNLAVADRIVDTISGSFGIGQSFIADKEIKILNSSLGR